ncbi:MAG: hypothetical protein ABL970_13455 [Nitrospira sp.]
MQLSLLFLIIFAVLIWGMFSGIAVFRILAGLLSGVIGLAGFAAAVSLISVGQKSHWTSDGPGMLLIMLAIPICGIVGFVFSSMALKAAFSDSLPSSDPHPSPQAVSLDGVPCGDATLRNRMMIWIVGSLLAIFIASSVYDHRARQPSHDARILAMYAYQPGGLASLDAKGELKLWGVSGHRASRMLSVDARPAVLVVTPDAHVAFVVTTHHQLGIFDLAKSASAGHTMAHIGDVCFDGGDSVLAIRDRKVVRIRASSGTDAVPLQGLGLASVLTCRADTGEVGYVDEANVLHLFDERTGHDRFTLPLSVRPVRLIASPEFRRLLAIDSGGSLSLIDLVTRQELPLPGHHRSPHVGFLSEDQIVIGNVSSVRVDIPSMKSAPYFNLGQPVTALATFPSFSTTLVAFDKELYLAHAPKSSLSGMAQTERLSDTRF